MLVKICGIKTVEAAKEVVNAGADFIGFVFASSKRQITPEKAAQISAAIPSSVKKVGVFVNESERNILQTAEQVGLDVIQLHGDETAEFAAKLPYTVIKAFPMITEQKNAMQSYPSDYYLVDSPKGPNRGGNGTTFDWNLLQDLNLSKIILAGGLTPENVQSAITTANPAGVDVSSGVETDGEKDLAKINQFIRNAKG
ncbi:phosphoribosylanthranilate isomerase [Virgibacillus litoralis]|uniref:N-(5'-phosphoribosyl)anthranilate isomerase n=1 Tax=Virgibacillus litoralis TaxID=578221 RepID=A0ABS4HCC2_9BACI|nr:phosphoribosylanthranilate isomerase [Virgibacillus litoralis]MBP1948565.1 phosphoribosylanthranilate isomerase [Virgibacillus litoralis]